MQFAGLGLSSSSSISCSWCKLMQWGAMIPQGPDLPKLTLVTTIGIGMAVTGNVLISLALNLQKLAHKQMEERRNAYINQDQGENGHDYNEHDEQEINYSDRHPRPPQESELQPLTSRPEALLHYYGSEASVLPNTSRQTSPQRSFVSRLNPLRPRRKKLTSRFLHPVDIISEDAALHGLATIRRKPPKVQNDNTPDGVDDNEGDYLKSKLWWTGFLLMNVGEVGNFISYAFAPASMVAPLGTFALIANCFFAPLLLGEHFRKRDLFGVIIAIIGAVTVVLASNSSDTRLGFEGLLRAISSVAFIVYSCIYAVGALCLASLSEGKVGKDYVFVDVGLCGLFGGFTVLSTKALSTLLTMQWIDIFTHWLTYTLILVLLLTGVGQIRYLNRALMNFDSRVVIPTQFVFFTLSAIIGSAILYGDFRKARFHQVVTFLYGCAATFAGVFIIAWSPKDSSSSLHDNGEEGSESIATENPIQAGQEGARLGSGSIGRRPRATLVLPSGARTPSHDAPPLRRKKSSLTTMGISPAQHLLLVHSPPRDVAATERLEEDNDLEHGSHSHSPIDSYDRRRRMSWYGNDIHRARNEGHK